MRGIIIKSTLMVVVVSALADVTSYNMTGKSWVVDLINGIRSFKSSDLSVAKLKEIDLPSVDFPNVDLPSVNIPGMSGDASAAKQTIYRWVDETGVINYTSEPPKGVDAEVIIADPNRNVIQAPKPLDVPSAHPSGKQKPSSKPRGTNRITETLQNAKDLKKVMENRDVELDGLLEQME